jgi:hypothetical protein
MTLKTLLKPSTNRLIQSKTIIHRLPCQILPSVKVFKLLKSVLEFQAMSAPNGFVSGEANEDVLFQKSDPSTA